MEVELRLFAVLRERAGTDRLTVELADGATVDDALAAAGRRPELTELIERMPIRVALNREYVDGAAAVAAGDELALIPPVSGGAVHARVTGEALSIDDLAAAVGPPGRRRPRRLLRHDARRRPARVRGLRRDGDRADCRDPRRRDRDPRARGGRGGAPGRPGAARAAERDRRGLGSSPRRGVRRGSRGDRPDQGGGADLEARGRRRRRWRAQLAGSRAPSRPPTAPRG